MEETLMSTELFIALLCPSTSVQSKYLGSFSIFIIFLIAFLSLAYIHFLSMETLKVAINNMNPRLAKIQEKAIVKQRKVPNISKKVIVQKKRGILAIILVSIPLNTLIPILPYAALIRSLTSPVA
mmetsp:Transcript_10993/g.12601  ORF Transcript_10993/g.12601 Transcript_10993/m.12601 type:complete len:125 (-) Transcript_10993:867-1241(-)